MLITAGNQSQPHICLTVYDDMIRSLYLIRYSHTASPSFATENSVNDDYLDRDAVSMTDEIRGAAKICAWGVTNGKIAKEGQGG